MWLDLLEVAMEMNYAKPEESSKVIVFCQVAEFSGFIVEIVTG